MNKLRTLLSAAEVVTAIHHHGSITRAAVSLGLTQSALSRRLRETEAVLGEPLFVRTTRRLTPTQQGEMVVSACARALALLSDALTQLQTQRQDGPVRVSTLSSIATRWLIPHLASAPPGLPSFGIEVSEALIAPGGAEADLTLRFGPGGYQDGHAVLLTAVHLVPVTSPGLLPAGADLVDLLRRGVPLPDLLEDRSSQPNDICPNWDMWAEMVGLSPDQLPPRRVFNRTDIVLQTAATGQGIGLGRTLLVEDDIRRGFLVTVGPAVPCVSSYWLMQPAGIPMRPQVQALAAFLRTAARETVRGCPLGPTPSPQKIL